MFYHHIYLKYIIIIFCIFTNFLNKTNCETCTMKIEECLYFETGGRVFNKPRKAE
jgi:hypothetical protein